MTPDNLDASTILRGPHLTDTQREVLRLVALGHTNKEIGAKTGVSWKTVESRRAQLQRRLVARNGCDLTRRAVELGVIELAVRPITMNDETNDRHFRESQEAGGRHDDREAKRRFDELPPIVRTRGRNGTFKCHYDAYAAQVKQMGVDTVLRFPIATSPKLSWFYQRARLNGFKIFTNALDGELIVVRVR